MLNRGGRASQHPARTHRELLSFGGVAFELLADERLSLKLSAEHKRLCMSGADLRAIADVVCAVHADPALPQQVPWAADEVRWKRGDGPEASSTVVRGRALQARIEQLAPQRYVVTAGISPACEAEGYLALLRGVSAAILQREGGLVLRAAALELDGQAVLFIGPRGAGKSTAVRNTSEGRCFAHDRVAVVPSAHGWLAWGLPGPREASAPLSDGVVFPLAAVLRVRQGGPTATPNITPLTGTSSLFALQESVECADDSSDAVDSTVRNTMRLASEITVGSIETAAGKPLSSLVRTALAQHMPRLNIDQAARPQA